MLTEAQEDGTVFINVFAEGKYCDSKTKTRHYS